MIRSHTTKDGKTKYQARVGSHGEARTFDRKGDAEEWEANQKQNKRRARAGLDVEKGAVTYDQLCDLYLAAYTARSKAWTEYMLGYSRKQFGRLYVRQLEPEIVGAWLHSLTLAPKTKHHILERMRAVLSMGVEWGYLSKSPVRPRAVKSPGTKRVRPIAPLESWEQVVQLADAIGTLFAPWSQLIRFVACTGLRPGEWQRLTWNHIDFQELEVNVPGEKNEASVRQVPLSDLALGSLRSLPTPMNKALPVFTTKTGKPFSSSNYAVWRKTAWKGSLALAGLGDRDPYELRHTFATLALQAGIPIEVVSRLMGHKSIEITQKFYAKYTRSTLHAYIPNLNRIGKDADGCHEDAAAGTR